MNGERPSSFGPSAYVGHWINYWGNVQRQFANRFQAASQRARQGTYTPSRMFADAVAMWVEGFEACLAGVPGMREPAIVFFRFPASTESATRTVRVNVPGDAGLDCTDLARVGGVGSPIARKHVRVQPSQYRDELTVTLVDLGSEPLIDGQYLGLVHAGQTPVAVIHVLVDPVSQRREG
ncbi:MAG TPA: hypothetical protein VKA21_08440 [Candidatus Binatia bacterium]|nr:hypothetical protein [Candidatus Binatia bacterium]